MSYDSAVWQGIWTTLLHSANGGDETSRRFVEMFRATAVSDAEASFLLWAACRDATAVTLARTESRQAARATLDRVYESIGEEVLRAADEVDGGESATIWSIPSTSSQLHADGFVEVVLEHEGQVHLMRVHGETPLISMKSLIDGAFADGTCIGFEITAVDYPVPLIEHTLNTMMGVQEVWRAMHREQRPWMACPPLRFRLRAIVLHGDAAMMGVRQWVPARSRRVQVIVQHMWNRDATEAFSVSSGLELSMLRTRALQSIPQVAHHRCSVLDHGRRITARSNLQVRDIVRSFDVHPLKIIQVTVGGRGGGKRKVSCLDDSQGSSSFGRRQEEETALEPEETALEPEETALEPEETALEPKETALEPKVTALEPEETALEPEVDVDAGPSAAAAAHESVPMLVGAAASSNVAAGKRLPVAGPSTAAPEVSNCVSESVTADPPHPPPHPGILGRVNRGVVLS
jgi:hypothetical protein